MNETNETPLSEQEETPTSEVLGTSDSAEQSKRTEQSDHTEQSKNAEPSEQTDPIAQLSADLKDVQDKYLRLYSDFDNFRKRNLKERLELIKTASETVILSVLPTLDDFDRALPLVQDEATKSGIELICNKLKTALETQGLKAMETKGVAFDADLHEAIAQTPVNDEAQKGTVIDEIQRGYYLNDKVIRHAKVIVGA